MGDDGQISDVLPGIDAHNFYSDCGLPVTRANQSN